MPNNNCPIRNPSLKETDLSWDLNDVAECSLEAEGVRYDLVLEAFHRMAAFLSPRRAILAD